MANAVSTRVSPDDELIASCAAFDELEHSYRAAVDADDDAAAGVIERRQKRLLGRIVKPCAGSLAAHRARAQTALLWADGDLSGTGWHTDILEALARDLTR